jgi:hypothetical protein
MQAMSAVRSNELCFTTGELLKRIIPSLRAALAGLVILPGGALSACGASTPHAADPILLPLTFIESSPVTSIVVGGRTVPAIVDISGGDADGELTLSAELVEGAHGISLGSAIASDAYGREFTRPRFTIPAVTIGGHVFRDVRAVQDVAPAGGEGVGTPNAIGKHLLSRYFVVVDYAGASISLWPPDTRNPTGMDCGHTRIRMERTGEERLVVSTFDTPAGSVRLLWSANPYSVLPVTLARKLRLATMTHGPGSPEFYQSKTLSVAGQDLGPLEFVVLPLDLPADFEGMLGRNFLDRHVVCLDYRRREIRIR